MTPPPGAPMRKPALAPPAHAPATVPPPGPGQAHGHAPEPRRGMRHHEPEEHEAAEEGDGNWIMSYADMMTLLMAFFALMFSFSKVDQKKFDSLRSVVAQQFGGQFQMPFQDLGKAIEDIVKSSKLEDKIKIETDSSEISIVFKGTVFFDGGAVTLRTDSGDLMTKLLDILPQRAKGYAIHVEGHTDDSPIATTMFPSNWELSAGRASAIVRMLEARGVPRTLLHAQGFADSRPIVPNRDEKGNALPDNQSMNRRVVIRVTKPGER
jgi:chemotaxis protein MotB